MTAAAPYGTWSSPVSTEMLTAGAVGLSQPVLDGADVYWLESRAVDGGRVVIVRLSADGTRSDRTAAPHNVRSRVHEYGGGAYAVGDGVVVFTNFTDMRVYRLDPGSDNPVGLTPEGPQRFGGLVLDLGRNSVLAVREDHSDPADVVNVLVRLDLHGDNLDGGDVLVSGTDFVSPAALRTDGAAMAWVTWEHPSMPWDATSLWLAELDADGRPVGARVVAGGPAESAISPSFRDGVLHLMSDRTGWWNLYAVDADGAPQALFADEHDTAGPPWTFGNSDYAFLAGGRTLIRRYEEGRAVVGVVDADGSFTAVATDAVAAGGFGSDGRNVVCVAGFADRPPELVRLDPATGRTETLRRSTEIDLDPADVSVAEPVEWVSTDGTPAYGFYYAPRNAEVVGPKDERPPLLVLSHGGPTSAVSPAFGLGLQYWTSRGFAVLDVNYGGSTGYGRAYRERLKGRWGIVDVDDCTTGALDLAVRGLVDRARLAIRGGSAGGYTTLAALTFRDVFAAGASHYGVGDLGALARDTHKFESRYLDGLVGPYPQDADVYEARSPVFHADLLDCALILLQGREDRVVPPDQAEDMAAAVRAKGLPVALLMFDGEGHGFRQAPNIIRAVEAELSFYGQVFGFTPADHIDRVPIDNL